MKTRTNKIVLFVLGAAFSAARGIKEGMIMHKPGVRDHPWFGWYHRIDLVKMAFEAAFFIAGWCLFRDLRFVETAALLVMMWEIFEATYAIARYQHPVPETENVLGTGINLTGKAVGAIHAVRFLAFPALLIFGGIT